MTGRNVLTRWASTAFGCRRASTPCRPDAPAITTQQNIDNMRRQLRRLGLSHDPRRSVSTADPSYYRWTQWIFARSSTPGTTPAVSGRARSTI
jgi:leucyl-tRNA synthetase